MLVKFDNGVEVDYDAYDAEMADAYAEMTRNFMAAFSEKEEGKPGKCVRELFTAVSDGCNRLFGDGKGVEICGNRPNMKIAISVLSKLAESDSAQAAEFALVLQDTLHNLGINIAPKMVSDAE